MSVQSSFGASLVECKMRGCPNPAFEDCRGLCKLHFKELYRAREHYIELFTEEYIARFDQSYEVSDDGCWLWTAASDQRGYPLFKTPARHWIAFRYAYLRFIGDISHHRLVLHRCGNVLCVNPEHLYIRGEEGGDAGGDGSRRRGGT